MAFNKSNEVMYHIQCKKGDVGRYVLMPGDPFRTDIIASYLDDAVLVAHNREHKTWTGYLNNEKVSVTSTGMGCPSTAIALEELIKIGADTFIRIGTAGPVCEQSKAPDVTGVICTAAVRDEGTTLHYIPVEYPAVANRQIVEALVEAAAKNGKHFLEGITQSKDSFYGEVEPETAPDGDRLKARWKAWEKGNVMCSEMEAAALFVISSIRQKRAGTIITFNDMPATIQIACDAIRLLIEQDNKLER